MALCEYRFFRSPLPLQFFIEPIKVITTFKDECLPGVRLVEGDTEVIAGLDAQGKTQRG